MTLANILRVLPWSLALWGANAALQYFELALEKDPNYALAYTGIAAVWGSRHQHGLGPPRGPLTLDEER